MLWNDHAGCGRRLPRQRFSGPVAPVVFSPKEARAASCCQRNLGVPGRAIFCSPLMSGVVTPPVSRARHARTSHQTVVTGEAVAANTVNSRRLLAEQADGWIVERPTGDHVPGVEGQSKASQRKRPERGTRAPVSNNACWWRGSRPSRRTATQAPAEGHGWRRSASPTTVCVRAGADDLGRCWSLRPGRPGRETLRNRGAWLGSHRMNTWSKRRW